MVGTKPTTVKPVVKAVKAKKPKAKQGATSIKGAPVSQAARVKGVTGKSIREQGTDQLDLVNLDANYKGIAMQVVFTPAVLPRLGQLAKSFQRIRYHRLRFEVITGCPSSAGGVYVTGFVKDATDPMNKHTASSTLLASGGQAVKVWQSTEVVVTSLPDLFYTSGDPSEERWSSPGSFVVAFVASPDQAMTIQVFCHWDVSLSQPTYESREQGSGFLTALKDMYSSTTNKYLSVRSGTSWTPAMGVHFDPPLVSGSFATMLSMRYAPTQNSTGNFDGIFGYRRIKCESNGTIYPVNDLDKPSDLNFDSETYAIFKGEKVEMDLPKNLELASWFRSPKHPLDRSAEKSEEPSTSGSCRQPPGGQEQRNSSPCPTSSKDCSTTPETSCCGGSLDATQMESMNLSSTNVNNILLTLLRPVLTQLKAEIGLNSSGRPMEPPWNLPGRSRSLSERSNHDFELV